MQNASSTDPAARPETNRRTGVASFPGNSRIHVSLNVTDLVRSMYFYMHFFGVEPSKVRDGYAKFDLQDPPINFSINENPLDTRNQGHLGIQVKSTCVVQEMYERLQRENFKLITEDGTECCYAVQTKLWVADPDGNRWEVFVTTEPDAEQGCGPDCICHQEFERSFTDASTA
ncbi:VOC family protein [Aquabacterium sp. A7-Y]|uniref:ArsI/CadI family heavy metal resistance metalloenzyme n=1 Tax=Aquabacterium sp. A7-Y TaxID=1349605 RepID=UPI00223DF714|nr:ArsI/CadI family heavy metal resistance metalloenzyme [Aquabacterium sp. A7-Y]MCW7540995.1 VOC family protein [Aquabacterium sp. A7-Y]